MKESNEHMIQLAELILPAEIFEYFDIINIKADSIQVDIYLDKKQEKPEGYELVKLISKGFQTPICIQDFPLRDKALYLHVRRRRWYSDTRCTLIGTILNIHFHICQILIKSK